MMEFRGALRKKFGLSGKKTTEYPQVFIKEPKHLVVFPSFKKISSIDVRYPLLEPFVYAHIAWNEEKKSLVYKVEEPDFSEQEKKIYQIVKRDFLELIDVELHVIKKSGKSFEYIKDKLQRVLEEENIKLTPESYVKIAYFVYRDFVGFNELEALFHDPYIEDIGCPGIGIPVYVIHRKFGSIETSIQYEDIEYLNNFVIKLAERCGRYISYAKPLLDGSLPDGSRVQATLAKDVTTKGPTFSIRKFRLEPYSPIDLINFNTASTELMAYLWIAIENKSSLLICGGVATGKTTFLNAISMFIPPEDKIVSIEDTRELNIPHKNWIPAVSRIGFGIPEAEGKTYGEVTLFELLKESFRQNPDYVLVGEVRGNEAYVMFQGMASGHSSIGTIHAGSVDDVIKRLETPPIELSPSLIETLDIVVVMTFVKGKGRSTRRVKDIVEIESLNPETGSPRTIRVFGWIPTSDTFSTNIDASYVVKKVAFEKGVTYEDLQQEFRMRTRILEWMRKHNVKDYEEVAEYINMYYKEPKTIIEWVENNTPPARTKSLKKAASQETTTGLKIMPG